MKRAGMNLIGLFCVVALACCRPTSGDSYSPTSLLNVDSSIEISKMGNNSDCNQALQMIRARDFRNWKGLPPDCDWTVLTGPQPEDFSDVAHRGLKLAPENCWSMRVELEGYSDCHLTFVERKAVLFSGSPVDLHAGLDSLFQALGTPSAKLDWDLGILPLPKMEWVFLRKGVALYLTSEGQHAGYISLFAPTTLSDYKMGLRLEKKKVSYPDVRGGQRRYGK
jgi:hypothetical protein